MKALQPTLRVVAVFIISFSCISFSQALQNFVKVGCFKDQGNDRALPDLIINHRINHPIIDWSNLSITINSCAKTAQEKGYVYFAVQFWGECWAGHSGHLTYDKHGPSTNCEKDVVGKDYANYVYRNTGVENECEAYKVLETEDRAMNYSKKLSKYLCDDPMEQRWYRFKGKAGNDMATSCTADASLRCGTYMAGWLKSTQPQPTDGIKTASVCFHDPEEKNCCVYEQQSLRIRNCGRFYVYYLEPPVIGCFSRYCGNGRYI